jgi:cellulose 1,4-beta-cellobiosidase
MHVLPLVRRAAALAASAVVATGVLIATPASPAQAQSESGCLDVDIDISVWHTGPDSGGFIAHVTLTNVCSTSVDGWMVGLTLAPGHRLDSAWNADWNLSGVDFTASNLSWNRHIPPGGSIQIGFLGSFTGGFQDPFNCTINGQPCGGDPGQNLPPEVTLTSPPSEGTTVPLPCAITLAADASDPDGEIDRVEFYVNDELVGTFHNAPYEMEIEANHPAVLGQGNVVFARAYDDGTPPLSTDSASSTIGWAVPPPAPMLIACPSRVELEEDSSTTVRMAAFGCSPGI